MQRSGSTYSELNVCILSWDVAPSPVWSRSVPTQRGRCPQGYVGTVEWAKNCQGGDLEAVKCVVNPT